MMTVPAREQPLSPTNSIRGLSAVALACQSSDGWSKGSIGVHGTCSMSGCRRTWWINLACKADHLCARSPGSNPNLRTRTAHAHISTRKHQDRDQPWLFGTTTDPYQAVVNGTAYQQGTVGPLLQRMGEQGLRSLPACPDQERDLSVREHLGSTASDRATGPYGTNVYPEASLGPRATWIQR